MERHSGREQQREPPVTRYSHFETSSFLHNTITTITKVISPPPHLWQVAPHYSSVPFSSTISFTAIYSVYIVTVVFIERCIYVYIYTPHYRLARRSVTTPLKTNIRKTMTTTRHFLEERGETNCWRRLITSTSSEEVDSAGGGGRYKQLTEKRRKRGTSKTSSIRTSFRHHQEHDEEGYQVGTGDKTFLGFFFFLFRSLTDIGKYTKLSQRQVFQDGQRREEDEPTIKAKQRKGRKKKKRIKQRDVENGGAGVA